MAKESHNREVSAFFPLHFLSVQYSSLKVKHHRSRKSSVRKGIETMKIYLSLLVLVGINCGAVLAIQFGDDPANLEQTK